MQSESTWALQRAALDLPAGIINLNAGTCSPVPLPVVDELVALTRAACRDPVETLWRGASRRLETGRRRLAAYLGGDAADLLLLNNTSYGLNTVLRSLPFKAGDELLTTDQEYDQYLPLLDRLAREQGVRLVRVPLPLADAAPLTPAAIVAAFAARLTERTRALFFSHVTSATGLRLPAADLAALARRHGAWSIVDGAHAPGLVPVDLTAVDADFYAANIHKWLMGATGSAFLHVRPTARAVLTPLMTMAAFDGAREPHAAVDPAATRSSRWAQAFEYQGTRNIMPLLVVDTVLAFRAAIDAAGAAARVAHLAAFARAKLQGAGFILVSHGTPELATALIACRVPVLPGRFDKDSAWFEWRSVHGVEVAFPSLASGTPIFRIAPAWFNTEDEITAFVSLAATCDWRRWSVPT